MSTSRFAFDPLTVSPIDRTVTHLSYISTARYSSEWNSMLHTHPCAEVFFITGGKGDLVLADRRIPLRIYDAIIVNSNVEHTEISSLEDPLEYIVIGVEGLEAFSGEEGGDGFSILHHQPDEGSMLFYFRTLLKEVEAKLPGYDTVCQDLLEVLLLQLMRRSKFSLTFLPTSRKSTKECAVVRRYIENHFKENLTLEQLAAVAHVNKYYLVHSFSREYGTSPINYLLSCRIRESEHLLAETSLSLSQIAGMLGFSSPSYFSQSFRRMRGLSPLQYRIQRKNESSRRP